MRRQSIDLEIQEMLGEGSQGRVFKALRRDPRTGLTQIVALKILHSENAVDLWKREFESLSKVRSPFCVQVFGFERLEQKPALVLEFVDGVSLAQLGKSCWLEEEEILEILAQAESALLDLNKYGLFHGDLSPQNILIDGEGQLRLLDFGLANCAGRDIRLTPEFTAPERLQGAPADLAADLFSLGRIEQFLRGHKTENSYLRLDPAQRALRALRPCQQRQKQLSQRVHAFQMRRQARIAQTKTQIRKGARSQNYILGLVMVLALLLTTSAAQPLIHSESAVLQIRTHHWHHVRLDGHPLGYAPISVPLEKGRAYRLEWISAKSRGSRVIQAPLSGELRLQDRDFLH